MAHAAAVPGPIGYGEERERHDLHTLPIGRPSCQHRTKAWDKVMNADRMDIGKPADQFSQKLSA